MAEKKTHKIVSASTGETVKPGSKPKKPAQVKPAAEAEPDAQPHVKPAKENGNPMVLRIVAIVLWLVAIVCEVLAVLILFGKINMTFLPVIWQLIVMIVLDLICVIIGSQLWKKANHIDPASEKNKVKFWLWNNMGVIVCVVAFVPIIILMLSNKNLDKKTKVICTVVAIIALLIGGLASYDWNPVSLEQKEEAMSVLGDTDVYWAPFGKVYHTHEDCSALNRSETLTVGTVDQAIAANRTRLCSFCARRDDITGVVTDERADAEVETDELELVDEELENDIDEALDEAFAEADDEAA